MDSWQEKKESARQKNRFSALGLFKVRFIKLKQSFPQGIHIYIYGTTDLSLTKKKIQLMIAKST